MMAGEGGQVMEEFGMARQSKREYLRSIYERYRGGRRTEKTAMLEEFCKVCGYNRKYAIGLLNQAQVGKRFSTGCVARRKLIWESWEKRTKEDSS